MVRRLKISPNGMEMSPPGINVDQAGTRRLIDPRFTNLQIHARGSGTMPLLDAGNSSNPYEWRVLDTFPALPGDPIAFVNTKYPGQDYVDFPGSMVPQVSIFLPDYGFTIGYVNWFKVSPNSIEIRAYTGNSTPPTYRYEIMKNLRAF